MPRVRIVVQRFSEHFRSFLEGKGRSGRDE